MRLHLLIHALPLEEQISFIVTVERPVILIEAPYRHSATIIDFNSFHVQVLKWLLVDLSPIRL